MIGIRNPVTSARFPILFTLIGMICFGIAACLPMQNVVSSRSPNLLQFSSLDRPLKGQFLFVFVNEGGYTCLSFPCRCPTSVLTQSPFHLTEGKLALSMLDLEPLPPDWILIRSDVDPIALYAYDSEWSVGLDLFSSFPFELPDLGISILGVNSLGDIQVQLTDGYAIVPVGYSILSEQKENRGDDCTVLHRYYLSNQGLIDDEDVAVYAPMPR